MFYGYAGSILRVDLTTGKILKEPLPEALVKKFIGGRGFVAKLLFDGTVSGIDPFDPRNMLIAATGPLTGHFLPASGKIHFGTKSPATGGYADSNMGGHFGPQLKYAGYDVLVITGKLASPGYLFISDDTVEIRSASSFGRFYRLNLREPGGSPRGPGGRSNGCRAVEGSAEGAGCVRKSF